MGIKRITKALTFVASTMWVAACSQMTTDELLNEAQTALSEDDYKQAIIHLKAAVQQSPQDIRPRIELARIYFDVGDMVSSITTFDKVLTQRGDINDFAEEYFLALYSMADLDVFEVTFEEFKSSLNDENTVKVETIAAVISGRSKSIDSTNEHLQAAKAAVAKINAPSQSERINDVEFIINQFLINENVDNIQATDALVQKYPEDWLIRSLIAEILQAAGDFNAAADNYIALLKLKPYFAQLNLKIGEALLKAKAFPEAEKYIDNVLQIVPTHPLANQLKSIAALSRQDFKSAARYIDTVIAQNFISTTTIYVAGISHFQIGNYEQALSYLEKLVDKFPPNHPGLQMYIAAKLSAGDYMDAYTLYERQPSLIASNTRLAAKAASALLLTGENAQAAKILKNIKADDFETPEQRQQLGIMKLGVGDTDGSELLKSASEEIVAGAASGNSFQSKLMLVAMKASEGDIDNTRAIIQDWIEAEPDNIENLLILVKFEKLIGNRAALASIYSKIQAISPSNLEATKFFADRAMAEGNVEEALDGYKKVLTDSPNDHAALYGAYTASGAVSGTKSGYRSLDSLLDGNASTTAFTKLYAAYLQQDYKEVVNQARSSVFNYQTQPQVDYLLAKSLMALKQPLAALDTLRNAIKSNFVTIPVYEAFFEATMMADGDRAAIRAMNNAPEKIKTDPQILLLRSHILVNQKAYGEARQVLASLPASVANSPTAQEIAGRISSAEQNYDEAIPALTAAFKNMRTTKSAQLLYKALVETGEPEKGLAVLEELANETRGYDDADLLYVSELSHFHPKKAIAFYEGLLGEQTRNWKAMNNIALLLLQDKQPDKAYKWISQALNIRPGNQTLSNTKSLIEDELKS